MNEIWANRLIAGDKAWANVPASRKNAVEAVLRTRVDSGIITIEQFEAIIGENQVAAT